MTATMNEAEARAYLSAHLQGLREPCLGWDAGYLNAEKQGHLLSCDCGGTGEVAPEARPEGVAVMKPQRIQRRRTRGWRSPVCSCGSGHKAIYVGRGSAWGNSYKVGALPYDGDAGQTRYVLAECFGRPPPELCGCHRIDAVAHRENHVQRIAGHGLETSNMHFLHITQLIQFAVSEEEVLWAYRHLFLPGKDLSEFKGHDLVCWCPLVDKDGTPVPCHADILLELANGD